VCSSDLFRWPSPSTADETGVTSSLDDWQNVLDREMKPPIVPEVVGVGELGHSSVDQGSDPDVLGVPHFGTPLTVGDAVAAVADLEQEEMTIVEGDDGLDRVVQATQVGGLLERDRRRAEVVVTAIISAYLGLGAHMDLTAASRLMREGEEVSGVHIAYDSARRDELFARIKQTPVAGFVALQPVALQKYRETLEQNLHIMVTIYVGRGMIIAFGVVYNFARISLSEQGREMASLRVLGLSRGEVSGILLSELAILTLLAQPLGWLLGHGIARAMVQGLENELYRVPLVIRPEVHAWASLVIAVSALASGLVVRRRIDRLDLIEVLKTRE
jgi:ABC-type lipoprotein release transport system permease subunit